MPTGPPYAYGAQLNQWFDGPASVYGIISGVSLNNHYQIKIINMPYFQFNGYDYRPQQVLVNWAEFGYGIANLQIFKHTRKFNKKGLIDNLTEWFLPHSSGHRNNSRSPATVSTETSTTSLLPPPEWTPPPRYVTPLEAIPRMPQFIETSIRQMWPYLSTPYDSAVDPYYDRDDLVDYFKGGFFLILQLNGVGA